MERDEPTRDAEADPHGFFALERTLVVKPLTQRRTVDELEDDEWEVPMPAEQRLEYPNDVTSRASLPNTVQKGEFTILEALE